MSYQINDKVVFLDLYNEYQHYNLTKGRVYTVEGIFPLGWISLVEAGSLMLNDQEEKELFNPDVFRKVHGRNTKLGKILYK